MVKLKMMKTKVIQYSLAVATAFFFINSCNKKETANGKNDVAVVSAASDSVIVSDSTILSHDSATVETAVGVQDEEMNAIRKEKAAAQKLREDQRNE